MIHNKYSKYIFILIGLVLISCGSNKIPTNINAEQVFNSGMELFEDGEYLEAQKYFDIITLQYPASQFADQAQFYYAEANFQREEYILAAYQYNKLRRVYPGSSHSKESMYKSAMCYYKISPPYDRDQDYTSKAIEAFMEFQYLYPDDSLNTESSKRITELRNKLAHREFFTAGLYTKMESPQSAVIYYDIVINNYSDTEYFEDAYIGKIESLYFMKKYDKLTSTIRAYSTNFPNGKATSRNNEILEEIANR